MTRRFENLIQLFRKTGTTGFILASGALAGLGSTYLISHQLGPEGVASYGLLIQSALLISVGASLGLDLTIIRKQGEITGPQTIKAALVLRVSIVVVLAALAAFLVQISFAPQSLGFLDTGRIFTDFGENWETAGLIALFCLARSLNRLFAGVCRALHKVILAQLSFPSLLNLFVFLVLLTGISSREALLNTAAAGSVAACLLSICFFLDKIEWGVPLDENERVSPLIRSGIPLMLGALLISFIEWLFLFLSARDFGYLEAGLIRVSWQVASPLVMIQAAVNGIIVPKLAQASASNSREGMIKHLKEGIVVIASLAILPFAGLTLFAEEILLLFGAEYSAAVPYLYVLLLGFLPGLLFSQTGMAMAMMGQQRFILLNTVGALATFGLLYLILPGIYGPLGLVLAFSAAYAQRATLSFLRTLLVLRNMGSTRA